MRLTGLGIHCGHVQALLLGAGDVVGERAVLAAALDAGPVLDLADGAFLETKPNRVRRLEGLPQNGGKIHSPRPAAPGECCQPR